MTLGLIGGVALLIVAVVLWRAVEAAAVGTLPRGGGIGIRTAGTTASDQAWTLGHLAAVAPARRVAGVCGAIAVVMMVAAVIRGTADPDALVVVLFVLGYVALGVGSVWIARVASRAARSAQS